MKKQYGFITDEGKLIKFTTRAYAEKAANGKEIIEITPPERVHENPFKGLFTDLKCEVTSADLNNCCKQFK